LLREKRVPGAGIKNCTPIKKTVGKLDFHRVCLQSVLASNMMSAFFLENIKYLKKGCKCSEEK
ncbi:hypothetical protein P4646_26860, partial [Peribacillus simplex]|uniref:hypothetical protein n=1 Tax=Peribacillus simplex TaxID=1478 RepID=UPI002E1E920E|nr:hypothetical protein [Peribacillus simplex]